MKKKFHVRIRIVKIGRRRVFIGKVVRPCVTLSSR